MVAARPPTQLRPPPMQFFHFGLSLRVVHNHGDISAAVTMSAPPQYSPQPSAAPQLYEHVLRKKYRSQVKLQQSLDCMFGEGTWEVKPCETTVAKGKMDSLSTKVNDYGKPRCFFSSRIPADAKKQAELQSLDHDVYQHYDA
ncbi:hypothetical protein PG999_008674 [Apiospora kogelbergensis]|uniref:Uncharacterized protein n=1 Tax=Apiospora kogelbergensis TaxID=1337665 RepID=A0AAW0QUL4_9PEZI